MYIPVWIFGFLILLIAALCVMVGALMNRVNRLKRIIRMLEQPHEEEHAREYETGDIEGR